MYRYHDYLDFHIHRGEDALVLQTCQSFGYAIIIDGGILNDV